MERSRGDLLRGSNVRREVAEEGRQQAPGQGHWRRGAENCPSATHSGAATVRAWLCLKKYQISSGSIVVTPLP